MIEINHRSARSLYEQVRDEFKKLIVSGALAPDERIPSVRDLAARLAVNPNTIQRAYRALEEEGFVYSVAGKGSFVAARDGAATEPDPGLLERFDALVDELLFVGTPASQLIERIERRTHD